MEIDGVQIKFYQKKEELPKRYYEIVVQNVRSGLHSLSIVNRVNVNFSKSTDSIYFNVFLESIGEEIIISIRSHFPVEKKENFIYIYVPKYKKIDDMVHSIQVKLIEKYNKVAKENNMKKLDFPKKGSLQKKINKKNKKVKKLKGTRTELLNVQEASFDRFLENFNKKDRDGESFGENYK